MTTILLVSLIAIAVVQALAIGVLMDRIDRLERAVTPLLDGEIERVGP